MKTYQSYLSRREFLKISARGFLGLTLMSLFPQNWSAPNAQGMGYFANWGENNLKFGDLKLSFNEYVLIK